MDNEQWKKIEGYDYEISNLGRVRSNQPRFEGKIIYQGIHTDGYYTVRLCKDKKHKRFRVHRLMAIAFIPNDDPINKTEIDHIDNNRKNNALSNLRWVTHSQNNINRSKQSNNTSGITGVSFDKKQNQWVVRMKIDAKYQYLGSFKHFDDAVKCRKDAEVKYFGEYAYKG